MTYILSPEEQRDKLRDKLQQEIADDPSEFLEWIGKDQHYLLTDIMNATRFGSGKTPADKYFAISEAIDSYVNRYIENLLP